MRDWTQWPTLAAYLDRARENGCVVQIAPARQGDLGAYQLATLTAPSGSRLVEAFVEENEPLTSTTISRFDRRLGLKSRFFI